MDIQTAIQVLELRKIDDPKEIRRAFRRLVKRFHPDQFAHQPDKRCLAEERLKQVNLAYYTLNEHLKKLRTKSFSDARKAHIKKTKGSQPDAAGRRSNRGWKQWLNAVLKKNPTPNGSPVGPNCPESNTGTTKRDNRSGFERILRQAQSRKTTYPSSETPPHRRISPVLQRQRRSRSARIHGAGPVQPVSPIRPVSGIEPIDGSD